MYLQRPSTGRSQDVRHILARTFRDLYTRDAVRPDVVKNLQVSKGGDDPYHERYVDNLQKVGFFNVLTRVKISRMVCLNDVFFVIIQVHIEFTEIPGYLFIVPNSIFV